MTIFKHYSISPLLLEAVIHLDKSLLHIFRNNDGFFAVSNTSWHLNGCLPCSRVARFAQKFTRVTIVGASFSTSPSCISQMKLKPFFFYPAVCLTHMNGIPWGNIYLCHPFEQMYWFIYPHTANKCRSHHILEDDIIFLSLVIKSTCTVHDPTVCIHINNHGLPNPFLFHGIFLSYKHGFPSLYERQTNLWMDLPPFVSSRMTCAN